MINVKLSTAKERRCCLSRFGVTLCSRATPHQFDAMQLTVTIFVFVVCGVWCKNGNTFTRGSERGWPWGRMFSVIIYEFD